MFILQTGESISTLFFEWLRTVFSYLSQSPVGFFFAVIGFILILFSQINASISNFKYEHRRNGHVFLGIGCVVFIAGLIIISHDYLRLQANVPRIFSSGENIELAYEYALFKESSSSRKEAEIHYKDVLGDFEEFSSYGRPEFNYFKAKIAFRYASMLLKDGNYEKASQLFNEAFLLYKNFSDEFETVALSDTMKSSSDFRFDVKKAYEALYLNANSNQLRAMSSRDELRRNEFLENSKILIEEILRQETIADQKFRSRVWYSRGEILEVTGENGHRDSYIFSYILDESNEQAIEKLRQMELFDEVGSLKLSAQEINDLEDRSAFVVFLETGGLEVEIKPPNLDEAIQEAGNIELNPFFPIHYPMNSCGDPKPSDSSIYPWALNPVYVLYPENELLKIKVNYCADAFFSKKENKIQVASFSDSERGHYFDQFLKFELGESIVETGATHVYCTINSKEPVILGLDEPIEEVCRKN